MLQAGNLQASHNSHDVQVVPMSHYSVERGQMAASTQIPGQWKGKNQLNVFLALAESLENQCMQNPTSNQNIHQANAKRKYGW
jgi:hypothetical protein